MGRSNGEPPSPWEAPDDPPAVEDPVRLLGDLLLGKGGAPEAAVSTREVRISTAFVLGGVCLGLAGFAAIALAQFRQDPYALRELGGVLGGGGLLVLLWGILVGLPANRGLRLLGMAGILVGAWGMAAFVWAYPQNWGRLNAVDHTVPVLATYVGGLVTLVAATFGSLVADFVLRMQVRGRLRGELGRDPTDDEIQRDIDEAMRRHKVTWGGMAPEHGKGLKVRVEAVPEDWQVIMPKLGKETVASGARAAELDFAVDKLLEFRGGRSRRGESPESGVGDAADALKALRVAKATAPKPGFLERVLGWFHRPHGGASPGTPARPPRPPR